MSSTMRASRSGFPTVCFVCGYDYLGSAEWPWGESGQDPSGRRCRCCGVRFGDGDDTEGACRRSRRNWLDRGARWHQPQWRPLGWALDAQLARLPVLVRGDPTEDDEQRDLWGAVWYLVIGAFMLSDGLGDLGDGYGSWVAVLVDLVGIALAAALLAMSVSRLLRGRRRLRALRRQRRETG